MGTHPLPPPPSPTLPLQQQQQQQPLPLQPGRMRRAAFHILRSATPLRPHTAVGAPAAASATRPRAGADAPHGRHGLLPSHAMAATTSTSIAAASMTVRGAGGAPAVPLSRRALLSSVAAAAAGALLIAPGSSSLSSAAAAAASASTLSASAALLRAEGDSDAAPAAARLPSGASGAQSTVIGESGGVSPAPEGGSSLAAPAAPSPRAPRRVAWGYVTERGNGPEAWASLSDEYAACGNEGSQSPVALSYRESVIPGVAAVRPTITLVPGRFVVRYREAQPGAECRSFMYDVYMPRPPPLVGDAPPVDSYRPPANPAILTLGDGAQYVLNGFHFHAPYSEHTLDGRRGVLELHFVFERRRRPPKSTAGGVPDTSSSTSILSETKDSSKGKTDGAPPNAPVQQPATGAEMAVVAVVFEQASESTPWLRTVLDVAMPRDGLVVTDFPEGGKLVDIDLSEILPSMSETDIYEYMGSLTTPPGSEGVRWIVLGKQAYAAPEDVTRLEIAQGGSNIRPLQALGTRRVVRFPAPAGQDSASS